MPGPHYIPVIACGLITVMAVCNKNGLIPHNIRYIFEHAGVLYNPYSVACAILKIKGYFRGKVGDLPCALYYSVIRFLIKAEYLA